MASSNTTTTADPDIPIGVLMGNIGAGKTTLCNKICGTNHGAKSQRGSCTTNLFQNHANCGSFPFAIIDTPGVDGQVETYKHAFLLKEALTGTSINTIFFVIKYDSRFDRMLQGYAKLLVSVEKYSHKIVLMISHMDLSEAREQDERVIREIFDDEYHSLKLIFFSNKDDPSVIVDKMHFNASSMKKEALQISDEDFILNFNIYQMSGRIRRQYDAFLGKARQIEEDYTDLIKEIHKDPLDGREKDELLHMCIVGFKNELESLTDDFINKYGADMNELDSFGFLVMMRKEKLRLWNDFTKCVSAMMSYSLMDESDPRNLIKRCPHCGEIWFQVWGCDDETECGNRPIDKPYDVQTVPWGRFTFTRFGRKLKWEKVNMGTGKSIASSSVAGNGVGCGKAFVWGNQPPIEDGKIQEQFHVKTIEEVKEIIKKTDYVQMRRQYEKNIDAKYHS